MKPVAVSLTALIRLYQWTIRPVLGPCCRFTPSCSEYAIEALRLHGAARGTWLASRRVLRCNPWCQAGYDPVPAPVCGCASSEKHFRAS